MDFWIHNGFLDSRYSFINKEINKIAITKIALLAITQIDRKSNASGITGGVTGGLPGGLTGVSLGVSLGSHWGLTGVSLGYHW